MRVCSVPGCPEPVEAGKCPTHRRAHEQARGSRQQRGYDSNHDRLRAEWAPKVKTGRVICWRCRQLITADEPWQLGHDDEDRRIWRGPEHRFCNLSAAGKSAHK
jgi:hypothetical protein